MKQILIIVAGLAIGFAIGTCLVEFNRYVTAPTVHTVDLLRQVDSLQAELSIKQTEVGRYEMALELFKEEDSVAADHFEYILSTQTE
jgi:hypothetical protein